MTLATTSLKTLPFEEMMSIYRVCVQLQQGTGELLIHADEMASIAINASIAAARSKGNQRVLSVLSSEAARLSRVIGALVTEIRSAARMLAKRGLFGVLKCRQAMAFTAARRRIDDKTNKAHIQEAIARCEGEVQEVLQDVERMREAINREWREIGRLNARITQISAAFRIEATRDEALGEYFARIASLMASLSAQIKTSSKQCQSLTFLAGATGALP